MHQDQDQQHDGEVVGLSSMTMAASANNIIIITASGNSVLL